MDVINVTDEFVICVCKSKNKKEIMKYIKDNNIHDLNTLRKKFNVGNVCGACCEDLETLIELVWND